MRYGLGFTDLLGFFELSAGLAFMDLLGFFELSDGLEYVCIVVMFNIFGCNFSKLTVKKRVMDWSVCYCIV